MREEELKINQPEAQQTLEVLEKTDMAVEQMVMLAVARREEQQAD